MLHCAPSQWYSYCRLLLNRGSLRCMLHRVGADSLACLNAVFRSHLSSGMLLAAEHNTPDNHTSSAAGVVPRFNMHHGPNDSTVRIKGALECPTRPAPCHALSHQTCPMSRHVTPDLSHVPACPILIWPDLLCAVLSCLGM